MAFEYKPVDRLNARPSGENTGDLKFPLYMLLIVGSCVGIVVLLIVGLVKLLA